MRKCDSCGKLYQESKDVFCPHCGAVAQKQCTHGSSFDSKRYNRGEIYKNSNPQYQNTTYTKGFEPHAQRERTPYNPENHEDYGNKVPQLNLPDFKKVLTTVKGKGTNTKFVSIIIFVVIFVFNIIVSGVENVVSDEAFSSDYEYVVENQEDVTDFYTVVNEATVEFVDTDSDFKTFTLEISGMGFDDYLSEDVQESINNGEMKDTILSQTDLVEMLICDFSKNVVDEESYNNALNDSFYYSGEQIEDKCKYEFSYSFDYDEIVHIGSGVSFYLNDGRYINAQLPFSAFSLSEEGEITYYTSYASDETAWSTVFEECSNEQDTGRGLVIDFGG